MEKHGEGNFSKWLIVRDQMEEKGKRLSIAELPGNTLSSFLGLSGRFDKDFVEERRKGLQVFMVSVVNHPWARFEEGLHKFLEDEKFTMDWDTTKKGSTGAWTKCVVWF